MSSESQNIRDTILTLGETANEHLKLSRTAKGEGGRHRFDVLSSTDHILTALVCELRASRLTADALDLELRP